MFAIYSVLLYIFSLFYLPYMAVRLALMGRVRAGIRQRLGLFEAGFEAPGTGRTLWVHAVSVGETLAAVPVVKELKERRPELRIYFSTVTETGQKVAMDNLGGMVRVFFFPFDFSGAVGRVLRRLRPDAFVVVETEIWPNLIKALNDRGIPALMVNGRISQRSFRGYKKARFFMSRVLRLMTHMNMQTAQDAERITGLGASPGSVSVAGNVKFDQACRPAKERNLITKSALGIKEDALVMVAGSTHKGEEEGVILAYRRVLEGFPSAVLVLAPRHPERLGEVESLLKREGLSYTLRSAQDETPMPGPSVILVDTMGELADIYRVGDINFVGGSWASVGGHNILEPVAFGRPVFFGPNMHNFEEISRLLKQSGVGIEVKDGVELAREAVRLLDEPERMETLARAAKETLIKNRGALDKNVELIERYLR